ncbi:hypothetical protein EHQ94_06955 [Leptospira meyeri]|uniref:hypothetical protein n=1 Tax=Leptospira meyeri TaxID=29508 RepID=UPI001082483A|nr:hypothetical protein [Leptospira meyeri]TGM62972.1 hypothetical protein EHQ93_11530 [Leptospira meyeri]TGM70610.1 hypothetical protein EHQ94_06955 [Leptospira meyeri]
MTTIKDKARSKLNSEIAKKVKNMVEIAKLSSLAEIQYIIFLLHINRIINVNPDDSPFKNKALVKLITSVEEESLKYILQLCLKFGKKVYRTKENSIIFNLDLVKYLIAMGNIVNSNFESYAFIDLFDIELEGKNERFLKFIFPESKDNSELKIYQQYFRRIDNDNDIKKNSKLNHYDLFKLFIKSYEPFSDLFEQSQGYTLNDYIEFLTLLIDKYSLEITSKSKNFKYLSDDKIDPTHPETISVFMKASIVQKKDILEKFDNSKVDLLLKKLLFQNDQFSEMEFRFHALSRFPLIQISTTHYLFSPELLLDSLFIDTHYSILEANQKISETYKKRASDFFLDQISSITAEFGFKEEKRDFDLFEGKKNIGDIDLVLFKENFGYLFIEAKNHSLPLEIYFKDYQKTKNHLKKLKDGWEKKVKNRITYLNSNAERLGFSNKFSYIIISKSPEIISHFSDLKIFTIQEFKEWLKFLPSEKSFAEIQTICYQEIKLHPSEMELLWEEGISPFMANKPTE